MEVHATEGEVFHDVPGYDAEPWGAVVELEDVVDAASCCGGVEVSVELGVMVMEAGLAG